MQMTPPPASPTLEAWTAFIVGVFTGVPAWISALAAMLTVAAAVGALWYAKGQIDEAKKSRDLARELELERTQPYVVVYTEATPASEFFIDLVVKNYGLTAANDIQIDIAPWPVRAWPTPASRVELPRRFPILAPGQEWRTVWDNTKERAASDLPNHHTGAVRYTGVNGVPRTAPIVLDWAPYENRRWIARRDVHDAAEALRSIGKVVQAWNDHGELKIVHRDGNPRDAEEEREITEALADVRANPTPRSRRATPPAPKHGAD